MKIAVCVKHVPEAQAKRIDPPTKRLDRSGEGALNGFDANAIEEALQLKDASGDGEVVLVSMGPEKAVDALRKGLAMGADRAVLISDEAAAGSDLVATSPRSQRRSNASSPSSSSSASRRATPTAPCLWAAVADRLRLPARLAGGGTDGRDGNARVKRQTEFGYDVIDAPLPAVVAVSDAINGRATRR